MKRVVKPYHEIEKACSDESMIHKSENEGVHTWMSNTHLLELPLLNLKCPLLLVSKFMIEKVKLILGLLDYIDS
jgi:hypothetical protein